LELNWTTFALEAVNFLVLVWILKRFLYKPVLGVIARRRAAIDRALEEAQTRHAEAQALERLADAPPEDHPRLLADLYRDLTDFDANDLDLLEFAGLLFSPNLPHGAPVG